MKVKTVSILICVMLSGGFSTQGQTKSSAKSIPVADTLDYSNDKSNWTLAIKFTKGKSFNYPTFSIWIEDTEGNYIESLYITRSIATGIYGNADAGDGKWSDEPGESIRPAALPYWSHKRNIISRDSLYVPTPENPVTDAVTGPTPSNDFVMYLPVSEVVPDNFRVLFEINQPWDWNDYWTNSKFPMDKDYMSSAQPSVVYQADITMDNFENPVTMKAKGHGHYSGNDGSMNKDLSTLTTALSITGNIQISKVKK